MSTSDANTARGRRPAESARLTR